MGMIFQNVNLFSSRNAAGNIAYPLEIAGYGKDRIEKRVDELLDMVGISGKRNARMGELSGGQKQRVAIARALATEPEIIFCDEATSALDPQTTRSILTLLKELQAKLKLTLLVVTHQMEVVKAICSHVAVLDAGRVAEEGTVDSVFSEPKSFAAREILLT
jgi:D-methionine transport system ATP-binding protein